MASHYWTRERRNESEHGVILVMYSSPVYGRMNAVCAVETVPYFREKLLIEDFVYANEVGCEENRIMSFIDYVFAKNKTAVRAPSEGRYRLFRQNHNGCYISEQRTDYAANAVDMFLRAAPLFEGAEIRLWDNQRKRLVATVKWKTEKTEFGFYINVRTNIFYDRVLGSIARQIRGAEKIVGVWSEEGASNHLSHNNF